jgi:ABC-type Fe3+ transport system substrate-binding protein
LRRRLWLVTLFRKTARDDARAREGVLVRFHARRGWLAAVLLSFAAAPSMAATITPTPALQEVIDAAKKEGALTLQYGDAILGGAEGAQIAQAGIKDMFGIDLQVTFHPGPSFAQVASKLYTEMQAGQKASTDVFNSTAVELDPYLDRGLFRKVPWTDLYPGRITDQISEADGRALRVVTATPGILYNKKDGADFANVHEMADLLKPEYKGRLDTEPYLAGFDVLVANGVWGYDKTAAFVKEFSSQIGGLVRCGATEQIAAGQIPGLAIDCGGNEQNLPKYKDVLAHNIIHDAAMRRFNYIAIPTNAAHPNAGILFALYVSSPDGQRKIQYSLYGTDLDTYPDGISHATTAALEAQGVKFQDVTTAWWNSHEEIDKDLQKLIKIITQQ